MGTFSEERTLASLRTLSRRQPTEAKAGASRLLSEADSLRTQALEKRADAERDKDPEQRVEKIDNLNWWLGQVLRKVLIDAREHARDPAKAAWEPYRSLDKLWEVAILILCASDGQFDPTSVGIKGLGEWGDEEDSGGLDELVWDHRRCILLVGETRDEDRELYAELMELVCEELTRSAPARKPLTDTAKLVFEVLCDLPEWEGLTSAELVTILDERYRHCTSDDQVRRRILSELRPWGVEHKPGAGYFIPLDERPERA